MSRICDECKHQDYQSDRSLGCSKARYSSGIDGYGSHKQGSSCSHDPDIYDQFEPKEESDVKMSTLMSRLNSTEKDRDRYHSENITLKHRLTTITITEEG